jgi:hypothetical protein
MGKTSAKNPIPIWKDALVTQHDPFVEEPSKLGSSATCGGSDLLRAMDPPVRRFACMVFRGSLEFTSGGQRIATHQLASVKTPDDI